MSEPLQVYTNPPLTRSLIKRLIPIAVIVIFVVALLYRQLLLGESIYWGDISLYFLPQQDFIAHQLSTGKVPLWNPYVLCGQPLVGNPQSSVFYPTTPLSIFMPSPTFFAWNTAIHLIIAGLGTYLFARRMSKDRIGSTFAAIIFAGSGFIVARFQFPPMVQASAWLPWILLIIDKIVDRPRLIYLAQLALFVGLDVLAGHTQVAYMAFGFAIVFAIFKLYQIKSHRSRMKLAIANIGLGFGLGVIIAFVQLLPDLQLFGLSTREKLTWWQANRFVLHPSELINFVFPYYHGSPLSGNFWGEGNIWESCLYVGLVPLVVSLYTVRYGWKRRATKFMVLAAVVSLVLAMGRFGGLFWFAFMLVPGISSFHDPARFIYIVTFAIAVLSAMCIRLLRDKGVKWNVRVTLVVIGSVDLWYFGAHFNPTLRKGIESYRPRIMAVAPKMGEGRVFSAQRDRVWQRYLNYTDYGPESTRYLHELTDTFSSNIGMQFGVEEGSGYEPVPLKRITEVDGLVRVAIERHSPHLINLLGLFNTKQLLLPQSVRFHHPGFTEDNARGLTVLTVDNPMPRAWMVHDVIPVKGSFRSQYAIASESFDPRRTAIVQSDGIDLSSLKSVKRPLVNVKTKYLEGTVRIETDARESPAYLVWSSSAYPGWKGLLDGARQPLYVTNHAFLGTPIPQGKHTVEFEYLPDTYMIGLYFSCIALLLTVTLMIGGSRLLRTIVNQTQKGSRIQTDRV